MDLNALITGLLQSPAVRMTILLLARLLPVLVLSPLFGGAAVPRRIRLVLAIASAVVLLPTALPALPLVEQRGFAVCLAAEVLHGLVAAVATTAILEVVGAAGFLVDLARDATIANILDPIGHQERSTVGALWSTWFLAAFFAGDGHLAVLRAWARGLAARPPGSSFFGPHAVQVSAVIDTVGTALAASLAAAAPLLLLVLIGKFVVAAVERLAKPMQAWTVIVPVAGLFGVLLLSAGLGEGLFAAVTRQVLALAGG